MRKLLVTMFVALLMVGCGDEKKGAFVYPNLKYQIKGDEVIITGLFYKKYCFNISSL